MPARISAKKGGCAHGTGAAPLEFVDRLGMRLQERRLLLPNALVGAGMRDHIEIGVRGKSSPHSIRRALAIGADRLCNDS